MCKVKGNCNLELLQCEMLIFTTNFTHFHTFMSKCMPNAQTEFLTIGIARAKTSKSPKFANLECAGGGKYLKLATQN